MLSSEEKAIKIKLQEEMKKQGATDEELNLITDEIIKNIIKNGRNIQDVAWAILQ